MSRDTLSEALAHAARSLNEVSTPEEMHTAIVRTARVSIPGADHVGICRVDTEGRLETIAATSKRVVEFDALQSQAGAGPCIVATEQDVVVHVPDVRKDRRWPAYTAEAARRGLRAHIGVRLYSDKHGRAGLNVYSERGMDEHSAQAADLFAVHAALALGRARAIDQLHEGMRSRQRIGVAVGILMHRYEVSEERAFAFLVRASSHGNVKLRDVAAEVVREFQGTLEEG